MHATDGQFLPPANTRIVSLSLFHLRCNGCINAQLGCDLSYFYSSSDYFPSVSINLISLFNFFHSRYDIDKTMDTYDTSINLHSYHIVFSDALYHTPDSHTIECFFLLFFSCILYPKNTQQHWLQ